jgi:hypothetical protein
MAPTKARWPRHHDHLSSRWPHAAHLPRLKPGEVAEHKRLTFEQHLETEIPIRDERGKRNEELRIFGMFQLNSFDPLTDD